MKRKLQFLGLALWWTFWYLAGLGFVAYLTDGAYVELNLAGSAAGEECDDCGAFMSSDSWFWVKVVVALYSAACVLDGLGRWVANPCHPVALNRDLSSIRARSRRNRAHPVETWWIRAIW